MPISSYLFPLLYTSILPLHFNSVEQILSQLENQPGWEKFREYRQLLKCWDQVVNQQIAPHTRPLYINRQILYIATDSAARAQELSFQRYTLLKRLDQQLPFKLKDIRFSSSQWHQKTYQQESQANIFTISDRYKSKIPPAFSASLEKETTSNQQESKDSNLSPQDRAKNAAQEWLNKISDRSLPTLVCPNCNSATSQKELTKWNLCYHCAAQKWSSEYRPSTFPESK